MTGWPDDTGRPVSFSRHAMRRLRRLLLACLLALPALQAAAQVVNTEGKRSFDDKDGWNGNVDLGFGLAKNIRTILQASSRVNAHYHHDRHTLLLLNDINFLKVDSNSVQNSGFQHVRYSFKVRKFLIPEAFVQAQYNQVWKLRMRVLVGAGPRFQILKNDSNRVFFGSLAMLEYERVDSALRFTRDLRSSSYLSMAFGINKHVTFESITYFQPLFARPRDFRLSSETSLRTNLSKRLSFKTSFTFNYDSRPPDARTKLFYSFQNGLSIRL